jgi:hypothetical protein
MAVLGAGGIVKLRRDAPESVAIDSAAINTASNTLSNSNISIWNGDRVVITCGRGLPFDSGTNGPDCPDGHAMYFGSIWRLGTNRAHITSNSSAFYSGTDSAAFYVTQSATGLTTSVTYYANRDQLDRLSFYTNRGAALSGRLADRVPIGSVDFGTLNISVNITEADWMIQGMLSDWSLSLTASEVDTTSVGERFGDAVKSIVSGSGTMDFFIEREGSDTSNDSTMLLNLLLLTEKGCKAESEFWMIDNRRGSGRFLPGDLYYATDLMITSVAINTRVQEAIVGSLNFVTVGEIALRQGIE